MPVRIPKARPTEILTFGAAGVAGFAPFYFLLPGAEQHIAHQTAVWAPRWERGASRLASPARRAAERVEPAASRAALRVEPAAAGAARRVEGRVGPGMARLGDRIRRHQEQAA